VYNGLVIGDVVTSDDLYTLYTAGTGDSMIGAPCTATECVSISLGDMVSLYAAIDAANGGAGICCDFNEYTTEITLDSAASVPEPAAIPIFGIALMWFGAALHRRRTLN
jgi:hypothetical protein